MISKLVDVNKLKNAANDKEKGKHFLRDNAVKKPKRQLMQFSATTAKTIVEGHSSQMRNMIEQKCSMRNEENPIWVLYLN